MYYIGESLDLKTHFIITEIYPTNTKVRAFEKRLIFARMGARMGKL